jgi:hypothetical protein
MEPIKSIVDLLLAIENTGLTKKENAHVRVWFRGQANHEWSLSPGVYRDRWRTKSEPDRLRIERHLSQEFRIQSGGILTEARDDAALYFLQQHYKMPTRLLDWTTNPLAALHFAVEGHPNVDGKFFVMDAYNLAFHQKVPKEDFIGIATGRNPLFRNGLQPIVNWGKEKLFPTFIMPVRPDHFERRMMLQKGCFTFHPPNKGTLTAKEIGSLFSGIVPKDSKPRIKKELSLLGIDAFAVYGDLDSLAARLKSSYGLA